MTAVRFRKVTSIQMERKALVEEQVPSFRRTEIRKYLELFGYNPDHTILQVHIAGYLGRKAVRPSEVSARERAATRYGGRTFTIVGRTHDPEILSLLIPPRKKREETSSGYLGYLFKGKDKNNRTPDEIIPLDFVPMSFAYPGDWKEFFGTRGYLIAMHVPSKFAKQKSELLRKLRRLSGEVDIKNEWKFIEKAKEYGYNPSGLN